MPVAAGRNPAEERRPGGPAVTEPWALPVSPTGLLGLWAGRLSGLSLEKFSRV